MGKIDPYGHKKMYERWKERVVNGIPGISKINSDFIKSYFEDMELGLNVAPGTKKGPRSFIAINSSKNRLIMLARKFEKILGLRDMTEVTERQLHIFFNDMRSGVIRKHNGGVYISTKNYSKTFKEFWHWHMRVQKKQEVIIQDITVDLDNSGEKPKWVYIAEENMKKLVNNAKFFYRVLIMFLFDTGIRSPTELSNIKVENFSDDFKKLEIPDEASKTFGRKINLMLCSDLVREYVNDKELKPDDYVFSISPTVVNRYLKRLATRTLGTEKTPAGKSFSDLTMYDFRHSSACYWLPRYNSIQAFIYRFGWKSLNMANYYTEFLGMRDTISESDLLTDVTKTEIEKKLDQTEKENLLMKERQDQMQVEMDKWKEFANAFRSELDYTIKDRLKIMVENGMIPDFQKSDTKKFFEFLDSNTLKPLENLSCQKKQVKILQVLRDYQAKSWRKTG